VNRSSNTTFITGEKKFRYMIRNKRDTCNGLLRHVAPREFCHSSENKPSLLVVIFLSEAAKLRKFEPRVYSYFC
jgi:hypothetical protein